MALQDIVVMAGNRSLIERVAAAAAARGMTYPVGWAEQNIWQVCAQPGMADAWAAAEATKTVNVNPDTGARTDVISDDMIDVALTSVIEANQPAT